MLKGKEQKTGENNNSKPWAKVFCSWMCNNLFPYCRNSKRGNSFACSNNKNFRQ